MATLSFLMFFEWGRFTKKGVDVKRKREVIREKRRCLKWGYPSEGDALAAAGWVLRT
jgi:hypothetical protein